MKYLFVHFCRKDISVNHGRNILVEGVGKLQQSDHYSETFVIDVLE